MDLGAFVKTVVRLSSDYRPGVNEARTVLRLRVVFTDVEPFFAKFFLSRVGNKRVLGRNLAMD